MATLNFPAPGDSTPGQKIQTGDIEWIYSAKGFWYSEVADPVPAGANVSIGQTPPTNPSPEAGDLWWNSSEDSGRMFIYTGSEWTESSPQGAGGEGGGGIEEAPTDGQQYARQNSGWSVVTGGGGDGDTTINYNGAAAWGSVDSFGNKKGAGLNFTSVRNSEGNYTITFDNPMPNAEYSVTTSQDTHTISLAPFIISVGGTKTATGFTIDCRRASDGVAKDIGFDFAVFATNALPPRGGTGADAWAVTSTDAVVTSSFNIASCNRPVNGQYDYTFTTPMPNDNYAVVATSDNPTSGRFCTIRNKTTTGFSVYVWNSEDQTVNGPNGMHSVVVHATNAQLPDTISQEDLDSILDLVENPPSTYGGASAWGVIDGATGNKYGAGLNFTSTRTSQGNYTVTFDTPMPDDAYSVSLACQTGNGRVASVTTKTATGFDIRCKNLSDADTDFTTNFAVHATNAQPPRGGTGADAWCSTSVDGTVPASFNIASVTRSATGTYDYVFTTPMPSISYTVVATPGTGAIARTCAVSNKTETGFTIEVTNLEGNKANESHYLIVHATNAQLPDTITQEELDAALKSPGVSAWGFINPDGSLANGLNCTTQSLGGGTYLVTFVDPMPNANYSAVATSTTTNGVGDTHYISNQAADSFRITCRNRDDGAGTNPADGLSFTVVATNAPAPKGGTGADAWASTNADSSSTGSFNLSVTSGGTGIYDYTFTTAMPNAGYAVVATAEDASLARTCSVVNRTTGGFRITIVNRNGDAANSQHNVVVHATNATLPATLTQEGLLFTDGRNDSVGLQAFDAGLTTQNTLVPSVGTTVTSTNLNFYEQGTFTPTDIVKDNGFKEAGGQNAGWGSVQTTAEYTRIGNICFFRVSFNNVSNSGTSGITPSNTQMTFKGLPFPPTGLTSRIPLSASISNNTSYSSAQLCAYIRNDSGTAQVLITGSTLSNSGISYNVVGTSNRINVSGHYMIDGA